MRASDAKMVKADYLNNACYVSVLQVCLDKSDLFKSDILQGTMFSRMHSPFPYHALSDGINIRAFMLRTRKRDKKKSLAHNANFFILVFR